jgi:O-antigen ligase
MCAIVMLPFVRQIATQFRRNPIISALLLWAICSAVWSQDAQASLIGAVYLTANFAFVFYLVERVSSNDLLNLVVLVGFLAATGSLILIVAFPQYGLMNRDLRAAGAWQGIFVQKNICGEAMGILLMPVFFVRIHSQLARLFRATYIVVFSLIIAMTKSTGAWIICGLSVAFIFLMRLAARMKQKDAFLIVSFTFITMIIIGVLSISFAQEILPIFGKDPTLTGRGTIWAKVMLSILKKPILGYGYRAFWLGLHGESANTALATWAGISYSENGVLDLWLELGVVGVALYIFLFARAVKDAIYCFQRNASPFVMWCSLMLFIVAISNIEGGTLLFPYDLSCILSFVAFVGLQGEARRLRSVQPG